MSRKLGSLAPGGRFRLRSGRGGTVLDTAAAWVLVRLDAGPSLMKALPVSVAPRPRDRRYYLEPEEEVEALPEEVGSE